MPIIVIEELGGKIEESYFCGVWSVSGFKHHLTIIGGKKFFRHNFSIFYFQKWDSNLDPVLYFVFFLDKIGFGFTDQSALKCQRLHSITNESKSFSSVVSFVFHVHRRSVPWTSLGRHLYMLVYARWQFDGEI